MLGCHGRLQALLQGKENMGLFDQLDLSAFGITEEPKAKQTKKPEEKKNAQPAKKKIEVGMPLTDSAALVAGADLIAPPEILEVQEGDTVASMKKKLAEAGFLDTPYMAFYDCGEVYIAAVQYSPFKDAAGTVSVLRFGEDTVIEAEENEVSPDEDDAGASLMPPSLVTTRFKALQPEYDQPSTVLALLEEKPDNSAVLAPLPPVVTVEKAKKSAGAEKYLAGLDDAALKSNGVELRMGATAASLCFYSSKASAGKAKPPKKEEKKKDDPSKELELPLILHFSWGTPDRRLEPANFDGKSKVKISDIQKICEEQFPGLKGTKTQYIPVEGAGADGLTLLEVRTYIGSKGAGLAAFCASRDEALKEVSEGRLEAKWQGGYMTALPNGFFMRSGTDVTYCSARFKDGAVEELPKIPRQILDEVLGVFRAAMPYEEAVRVYRRRSGSFYVQRLEILSRSEVGITFESEDGHAADSDLWLDIHSHGSLPAFFSDTDMRDSIFPGLYAVVGRVDNDRPDILVAAIVDGYMRRLKVSDIFG